MNPNLQRAHLLVQQSRFDLAEAELRKSLASEPEDSYAHALLALCLANREEFKEATEEAERAIGLDPDDAYAYYAYALVLYDRSHYKEAQAAVERAIQINSSNAAYFSLLSGIHFEEKRWAEALKAAEQGLQIDPEHVGCANRRAMSLVKLGRRSEAGAAIGTALAKNPENSLTHANQGWTLLETGEHKKALEHFRESLRLDPENAWARRGIVEALKARHFIYALMLKYFLWMSKLRSKTQWMFIMGGYVGNQILGQMARTQPQLALVIWPIRIAYLVFVLLTWMADPIFNTMLRLNRFGRLVLTREQTIASNWMLLWLGLAVLSLVGCAFYGIDTPFIMGALVFGLLALPTAGVFKCPLGWPRKAMAIYTTVLGVLGVASLCFLVYVPAGESDAAKSLRGVGSTLLIIFAIGAVGSGWVVNILISQRPKR